MNCDYPYLSVYVSLPTRKCGLKWDPIGYLTVGALGHFLHGSEDWNDNILPGLYTMYSSLPTRKCGLKFRGGRYRWRWGRVTSYTEVWIEIIDLPVMLFRAVLSLPTRKCGLKWCAGAILSYPFCVTSYTEVWIEIHSITVIPLLVSGHFLHGSVDWNSILPAHYREYYKSLPTRKCGLKFTLKILTILVSLSLPLHGSVEWKYHANLEYFNDNSQEYYTNIPHFGVITVVAFNKNR